MNDESLKIECFMWVISHKGEKQEISFLTLSLDVLEYFLEFCIN